MKLAINKQTNEAFLVQNVKTFTRDCGIKINDFTAENVFTARGTGKFPNNSAWKYYKVSEISIKFAERMLKDLEPYMFIGRPWLEETVFEQFQELQLTLNRIPKNSIKRRVEGVKENSLALIIELVELLQELPHKSWRSIEAQTYNQGNALEELIDVFFFVFNIGIAMNWTYADLIITMAYKMKKNFKRVEGGYNKTN